MVSIVPLPDGTEKFCSRCRIAKPLSAFDRSRAKVNGIHPECKECRKLESKETKAKTLYAEGYKRCYSCRRIKPFEDFYKSSKTKDGYGYECKECNKKRSKKRHEIPYEVMAILPHNRRCKRCEETKLIGEFYISKGEKGKARIDTWCKDCRKKKQPYTFRANRQHIVRTYGITIEQYDRMYEAQNGVCASCGLPETKIQYGRVMMLAVDHDHETGRVRGLLCADCNRALGLLKDNPSRIAGMLKYVQSWNNADV